jgi:hypothetical protein
MGQVPDGYHRVRAHIRRNPAGKGSKRMSACLRRTGADPWVIAP